MIQRANGQSGGTEAKGGGRLPAIGDESLDSLHRIATERDLICPGPEVPARHIEARDLVPIAVGVGPDTAADGEWHKDL